MWNNNVNLHPKGVEYSTCNKKKNMPRNFKAIIYIDVSIKYTYSAETVAYTWNISKTLQSHTFLEKVVP